MENTVLSAIQLQIKLVDNLAQTIDKINAAPKVNTQSNRLLVLLKHHEEELQVIDKIQDDCNVIATEITSENEYLTSSKITSAN